MPLQTNLFGMIPFGQVPKDDQPPIGGNNVVPTSGTAPASTGYFNTLMANFHGGGLFPGANNALLLRLSRTNNAPGNPSLGANNVSLGANNVSLGANNVPGGAGFRNQGGGGYEPSTFGAAMGGRPGGGGFGGFGSGGGGRAAPMGGGPPLPAPNPDKSPPPVKPLGGFEEGGLIGPGGMPVRPGAPMPSAMEGQPQLGANPEAPAPVENSQLDAEASRVVRERPQETAKIRAAIEAAIASGELSQQELNMVIQLAKTALNNPASYPQLRQFAIKNGLGTEDTLPAELDQGLLFALLAMSKIVQANGPAPAGNPMQGVAPMQTPMAAPGAESKPVSITAHEDEYVIPKDALMYHGKKTFDGLVAKAREPSEPK